jgi:hypothetical protein
MSAALDRLRPHPHRGDVIAAGAVPLAVAAIVIELRMTQWSLGPRFGVVGLIATLVLTMGWLAPLEGDSPRVYHSVLLVCGLLPLVLALMLLAEIIGASRPPGTGGLCWVFAVEAVVAGASARRFNSGVCTLVAAVAAGIAVEAFVVWVFRPHGPGTFRAILLVLTLAFGAGATQLRDHRRRHAVQLVNAAGLAALVLGASLVMTQQTELVLTITGSFASFRDPGEPGVGWAIYLLAIGFGLIAYACVDREAGPAYIGTAVLLTFAYLVGTRPTARDSFVGWPLFLLVIGAVGLVIGLRPRRELPPPPGSGQPATTVQLHPAEDGPDG